MQVVRFLLVTIIFSLLTVSTASTANDNLAISLSPVVVDQDNSNTNLDLDDCIITTHSTAIEGQSSEPIELTLPTRLTFKLTTSIRAPPSIS